MSNETISTTCAVAGGDPAGLMLGFLLARAGVPVVVLEKHADFLRDFRGDTIHPSTLELMAELGLDEAVLRLRTRRCRALVGRSVARRSCSPSFRAFRSGIPSSH